MNKKLLQGSMFMLLLFLLGACSEDTLEVGIELLPESDQLIVNADTLSVECYTFRGWPGSAYGVATNSIDFPIGHIFDPVFGNTYSDVTMGFNYDTSNYYRADSLIKEVEAVSLKLYLYTTDLPTYGNMNGFDIEAYLLNSVIQYNMPTNWFPSVDLYTDVNRSRSVSTTHDVRVELEDFPYIIDTTNPLAIDTIPLVIPGNYTVVELDNDLANVLLDTNSYDAGVFREVFPALLLKSVKRDDSDGGLQSFNPSRLKTILVAEYKRPTSIGGADTTLFSTFNPEAFHCHYRHNRNGDPIVAASIDDTTTQINNFYLQGLGGTRGVIKLKGLQSFRNEKNDSLGINFAELVLPISQESIEDTLFKLPTRISAQYSFIQGNAQLTDELRFSNEYSDGYLDTENWEYRINITETVSEYMLDEARIFDELVFSITYVNPVKSKLSNGAYDFSDNYWRPARVILESGLESLDNRAYLRVIHTKVK